MTDGVKHSGTSGGYADKKGNQYELIWAINYALMCIQDERRSITYEDLDSILAEGSEFTYVDEHGVVHVFQIKRQNGISDKWTINDLKKKGIFETAKLHVKGGRQYHFGSMTPCTKLRELSERSRESGGFKEFEQYVSSNKQLEQEFEKLAKIIGGQEEAWQLLCSMHFVFRDETEYRKTTITLAEAILDGAEGSVIFDTISSVLSANLRKHLTKNELLDALKRKGIFVPEEKAKQTARNEVRAATKRWQSTIQRELLDPEIPRDEATQLISQLDSARLSFVIGAAGSGKSAVINQVVKELKSQDAEVLAFRLDRCEDFNSIEKLGEELVLSKSPVASLRRAADKRDAVLVIDQFDTISLMSGRLPNSYDAVADLVDEAMALDIRVIVVCRLFDFENDHRIRKINDEWKGQHLVVGDLSDDVVADAVTEMGGDIARLTAKQRELLKLPLHLVLFKEIIDQPDAYSFTTPISLFNAFWDRKRKFCKKDHPELRFNDTLELIAKIMSNKQVLSILTRELDGNEYINHAEILASENLLVIDNRRVSFFHEAFFDYVFARQWLSDEQNLVEFLCSQEQGLFRRAQVRQILEMLLAEEDFERFREEIKELLLEKKIRFHIKEIAIIIFGGIRSPKDEDLDLALRIKDDNPKLGQRLWLKLTGSNWFRLLYDKELIQKWFDSDDPEQQLFAHTSLHNAIGNHDEIAIKFLAERYDPSKDSEQILRFLSWVEIHKSRPLLELLLDVARSGGFSLGDNELWIWFGDLTQHKPSWMIELLNACLESILKSKNDTGIMVFGYHNDGFNANIEQLVKSEPKLFLEKIIPYLLDAIRKIEKESISYKTQLSKAYLNLLFLSNEGTADVGMALYNGTAHALAKLASTRPEEIEPLLHKLADDKHVSVQALLFHAFKANPEYFADWAAELILENYGRLQYGDASVANLIFREVVQAIAPQVSSKLYELLEDKFRDLHVAYEKESYKEWYRTERGKRSYEDKLLPGRTAFKFLSELDCGRLSPLGIRRLAEYRRKFSLEVLSPIISITGGVVGPPISSKAAAKMSDRQWFRAMHKYHDQRVFPSLEGGAYELSTLLNQFTVDDPLRFAGLAMKMTLELNSVYPSAILLGFSEASIPDNAKPVVFEAIRHITNLGLGECDKYLGWSIRHLAKDVPLDLVEKVIDRTLYSFRSKSDSSINTSPNPDLEFEGINTTRGSLAYSLANLLSYDKDGTRTAKVTPHLVKWASDPVLGVRTCVAHIIGACLQHEPSRAYEAFDQLIDTDDILLTTRSVERLILYIGKSTPEKIDPVVDRMLKSKEPKVREAGGNIAVIAACHWNRAQLMERILAADVDIRKGAAEGCVKMISVSQDSKLVLDALHKLMNDEDDEVRKKIGEIAKVFNGHELCLPADFLKELIKSPTYIHVIPQLLIHLEKVTDKVDDLIDLALHRFIEINGDDIANMQTRSYRILDLVIRGLAQAKNKKRISALLDILDRLVEMNVYGINEKIERIERH